jgi:HSP20 family molecular chaperone IbpA
MSHELVPKPPEPERSPDRMEAGPADEAGRPDTSGGPRQERYIFTPPIDIYESDEGLVLHADLPGVSLDTLELQVQENKLTLFGRVRPAVPPGATILHQEYEVGDFLRSFILSDEVDHERIAATLNNGVLKVLLPKAQRPEPRRIQVSTE